MYIRICIALCFLFGAGGALAQLQVPDVSKVQLANKYYQGHEYEKAAVLYDELFQNTKSSYYFDLYLTCLTESGDFEAAEKEIKKALRKDETQATLYVQWATLLKKQGDDEGAEKKLQESLEAVPASRADYIRLSNAYLNTGSYDYAEKLYLQAPQKIPGENFYYELGRVYLFERNYSKMFDTYLDMIRNDENTLSRMESAVQSAFRLDVDNSLREKLKSLTLQRMQQEPTVIAYNRLLIWLFLQEKNYTQALRQQIALDRRGLDESPMIMELARIAARNDEYTEALKAYDYLISKGDVTPYFYQAKLVRADLLYRHFSVGAVGAKTSEELAAEFEKCFGELGYVAETQILVLDYAHLLAFHLNRADKAVELLEFGMKMPRLQQIEIDELKTELADVYVLTGDVYEAILLYSQVIENNKTNELGDQVKLKKARLGYYMGEMAWAKAQLDVLKASTSKLIANDAMELALFIGNNMNLDTTSVPLQMFARADLLQFRNQTESAWAVLDSLQNEYPFHSLQDDIYYRKASIMEKQAKWTEAASFLEQLVADYPWDLLADDALLELGNLYRTKLNDPEKAQGYYLKLLEDHPGSVHVSEARNWYRQLRGDFDTQSEQDVRVNETIN
ncbi:tetratricopeptide repeat protein [Mangrovibacterium diazotrophicum]|uniref:Tetratricopeptide repeat protein n=1 Tax=Mangrovibacterium diazotrophicum TaxID=1261403 RepID=A0A419W8E8_9BACT|nr:tetratricopeptide repeat protein [Mangrovibacterium diazotrophicum]RKD91725.1 tetratricopeptide repeat protein [Mangrovibacterium diazotrophicum]